MKKILVAMDHGNLVVYKKGKAYQTEMEPEFYIGLKKFRETCESCNKRKITTEAEFYKIKEGYWGITDQKMEICTELKNRCSPNECNQIVEGDARPEYELREDIEKLVTEKIKDISRKEAEIEYKLKLEKIDNEHTSWLEQGLAKTRKEISLLEEMDPKTVKLVYIPCKK